MKYSITNEITIFYPNVKEFKKHQKEMAEHGFTLAFYSGFEGEERVVAEWKPMHHQAYIGSPLEW